MSMEGRGERKDCCWKKYSTKAAHHPISCFGSRRYLPNYTAWLSGFETGAAVPCWVAAQDPGDVKLAEPTFRGTYGVALCMTVPRRDRTRCSGW